MDGSVSRQVGKTTGSRECAPMIKFRALYIITRETHRKPLRPMPAPWAGHRQRNV